MTHHRANKVAILVESLYIPEELEIYERCIREAGLEVVFAARLWGNKKITIYSDNVSDTAMDGPKPSQQRDVFVDVDEVRRNLDAYAAVLVAANYTSVRSRYYTAEDGGPRNAPAVRLFAEAMARPSLVKGALCHGLWLGTPVPEVLAGRKVICHEVVRADIINAGATITLTDSRVVADGDLVTGYSKHEAAGLVREVLARIQRVKDGGKLRAGSDSGIPEYRLPPSIGKRRVLVLLSEWGYWGEELLGPLEVFDAAGYEVAFCTPTGKRPNAIPVSMDPGFVDPPLNRAVTTAAVAARVRLLDDPETEQGKRLSQPLNLSEVVPLHPYAAAPSYVRALEAYNRQLSEGLAAWVDKFDALVIVGGSGPVMDLVNNGRVHDLILAFVTADKPVAAECYGVACLAFARDWESRESLIRNKFVTGHCLEYDYQSGTAFVKARNQFLMDGDQVFNFGPPPYPLEYILRDATAPEGRYVGNFGKETSVVVDYPFVTGRSTPDSYLTGQKLVEVLETGLRQWGIPNRPARYSRGDVDAR